MINYQLNHLKKVGYLILVALSLIARTYADVFMIIIGTSIER
jgi:hypothetical protein